jgi:hypothetical protein
MKQRLAGTAARTGRGAGFGGEAAEQAAQRLQARQAADISLGRERDLDQLAIQGAGIRAAPSQFELAQRGLTAGAAGQMAGFAPTGAQLGLQQQGLGLQQWQTAADTAYKQALLQQQQQQGQLDAYMKMAALSGY